MNDPNFNASAVEYSKTAVKSPENGEELLFIYGQVSEIRVLFETLLKMWNYRTVAFQNLDDLLAAAKLESPDLILMDSVFPFQENLETLKLLRTDRIIGILPIVVLSGFAQSQFRNLALECGASEYLPKPVDFDTLEIMLKLQLRGAGEKTVNKAVLY